MLSFIISLVVLIGGYFIYGAIVERFADVKPTQKTPAYTMNDGIDYVPLPTWKVFLIQFLNIAGLGPIFGAIMGVLYGPAAFLWIALGTIFGGAVHDYLSGMISLKMGGVSLPEIVGKELGLNMKVLMRIFAMSLMILVGAVFVVNPAAILAGITSTPIELPDFLANILSTDKILLGTAFWTVMIFAYYILATLLPIDKIIGNLYPIFGFAILFMAVGVFCVLITQLNYVPEFTSGLHSRFADDSHPLFPMMFVSIACGAISGFHATQSPMMARCLKNEKYGRRVFYGAMVAEGIVALIWAAAAIAYFKGDFASLQSYLAEKNSAAPLVKELTTNWLGAIGGLLAIIGVVVAPISTGDTALRTARLMASEFVNVRQDTVMRRICLSLPIFVLSAVMMSMDFAVLWRYFGWCNQTLAVFTLWAITVYLARRRKFYYIAMIPAMFMTMVCCSYILCAPEGFPLDSIVESFGVTDADALKSISYYCALGVSVFFTACVVGLFYYKLKNKWLILER